MGPSSVKSGSSNCRANEVVTGNLIGLFNCDKAEIIFSDMIVVINERHIIERIYESERIKQVFIDYIMRKNKNQYKFNEYSISWLNG